MGKLDGKTIRESYAFILRPVSVRRRSISMLPSREEVSGVAMVFQSIIGGAFDRNRAESGLD